MKLAGKIAIVTGGSDGIGRATALALARSGCDVAICARDAELLDGTAGAIRGTGRRAVALAGDISDRGFCGRLVGEAVDRLGGVDILVNNAGIGLHVPVQQTRREDLARLFAVNLEGALWCMQAVLPALRAQRSGAIVNVASLAVQRAIPGLGPYAASKAALAALSRALRVEALRDGIQVIVVYPGLTRTSFGRRSLDAEQRARSVAARARRRRVFFVAPPERVADAIVAAIRRGRSEVWVTKRDRLIVLLSRLAPGLCDRLIALIR